MQNYLNYLQSTLGLDHVILPEITTEITAKIHFQCVSDRALSAQEVEMFEKIMTALKAVPGTYVVSTVSSPVPFEAPLVVLFTDEAAHRGEWMEQGTARVLRTHSLASMMKDPGLKKQCWAHLQTIPLS